MSYFSLVLDGIPTVGLIVAAMSVVAAIEAGIPLHPRGPRHRAHLGPNLALTWVTFGTNLFLNAGLAMLLAWLQARDFGLLRAAQLDPIVAGVIGVLALDLSFYVAHVAMHKAPALWRIHRVHHSDPVLDVTTSIRQHPAEGLVRYVAMTACAGALGVGLTAFAVYRLASALSGLLEHANFGVPRFLDRVLPLFTTWPNFHKIHHSRVPAETDSNYGNLFPWFDHLFETYTPAWRGATVDCGLEGFDAPHLQTTRGLLALPFVDSAGRAPAESAPTDLTAPGTPRLADR